MPKRKTKQRAAAVSPREIEALRRAIMDGYPWALRIKGDDKFRQTGLSLRLNILLSYITGIAAGAGVFLSGGEHPSRETVAAVKAELKDDIENAEKRFKGSFVGKRHADSFFRDINPYSPPRREY
jgi:hypothetical protein